jgi:hypothetical protein
LDEAHCESSSDPASEPPAARERVRGKTALARKEGDIAELHSTEAVSDVAHESLASPWMYRLHEGHGDIGYEASSGRALLQRCEARDVRRRNYARDNEALHPKRSLQGNAWTFLMLPVALA